MPFQLSLLDVTQQKYNNSTAGGYAVVILQLRSFFDHFLRSGKTPLIARRLRFIFLFRIWRSDSAQVGIKERLNLSVGGAAG